jgi:hypothetical protein
VGDALAKSKKKPAIDGVEKKLVLRDATRTLELHHVERLEHSDGMLIAYLPKERILFTADFPLPVAGQPMNPSAATLVENLNRLGLDFDRYVTVHAPAPDRPLTRADVMAPASRYPARSGRPPARSSPGDRRGSSAHHVHLCAPARRALSRIQESTSPADFLRRAHLSRVRQTLRRIDYETYQRRIGRRCTHRVCG